MKRAPIAGLVGLLAFTLLCPASCAAASAAAAPEVSSAPVPAVAGCQDDLSWLAAGDAPAGGSLVTNSCWGHCYVELNCPDFRYVGCYGSHAQACGYDGEYVVCDGQYYDCAQCKLDEPFALGCEYC